MKVLLTVAIAVLIIAGISIAANLLAAKKINLLPVLEVLEKGLGYADALAGAITPFVKSVQANAIKTAVEIAEKAVLQVEESYKAALSAGSAAVDTRKAAATTMILTALSLKGIKDTPEIDKLVSVVIDALVLALPKTHTLTDTAQGSFENSLAK